MVIAVLRGTACTLAAATTPTPAPGQTGGGVLGPTHPSSITPATPITRGLEAARSSCRAARPTPLLTAAPATPAVSSVRAVGRAFVAAVTIIQGRRPAALVVRIRFAAGSASLVQASGKAPLLTPAVPTDYSSG